MKLITSMLLLFALLLPLGSAALPVHAQTPAADTKADTKDVIMGIVNALNAGNVEGALALVAEQATIVLMPPPPTGATYTGKEAIGAWWETLVSNNSEITVSNFQSSGPMATWSATVSGDDFQALGIESLAFDGVGIVHGGQLQSYTWIITEESQARLQTASQLAANRQLATRYLEEMWDNGDMEVAQEILADDFIDHYPLFGNSPDKAGLMADAKNFHADGAKNRIEDLIVTPETIVIRDTVMTPDENGDLQETLEAAIFLSVEDGQITERRIAIFGLEVPPPSEEVSISAANGGADLQ